jgi:cell division FtsZ-interacting protein ZapD
MSDEVGFGRVKRQADPPEVAAARDTVRNFEENTHGIEFSEWEEDFIRGMARNLRTYRAFTQISEVQQAALDRIRTKLDKAG